MSLKSKLRIVGLTDTGKVREHNEDTIAFDPDIGLLVLADGMGGYNAGEVASGIAVKTIVSLVREQVEREDLSVHDRGANLSRPSIILRDAIHRANKIIYQTARTQPQCEGMGTTVVAALFFDNRVTDRARRRLAHVPAAQRQVRAGDDGSLAAAGAGRPRVLLAPRRPSGRRTRTTSRAPSGWSRTSRSRSRRFRCRRARSTCSARTASRTWSRTTISI